MARWVLLYVLLANVLIFFWYSTQYSAQVAINKEQSLSPGEQKIVLLTELSSAQREGLKREE